MNPYEIEIKKLEESQEVIDAKDLLKLKLTSEFLKATAKMETREIISITGLHKSDLSRLRALNTTRFTIDRIVGFLDILGFSTSFKVKPKKVS